MQWEVRMPPRNRMRRKIRMQWKTEVQWIIRVQGKTQVQWMIHRRAGWTRARPMRLLAGAVGRAQWPPE